jgi:hypothetical protein
LHHSHVCYIPHPSQFPSSGHRNNIWWTAQITKHHILINRTPPLSEVRYFCEKIKNNNLQSEESYLLGYNAV